MLEDRRRAIIGQANFEVNLQEEKAEHAVQNLMQQLQQDLKLFNRSQDCESSRYGQFQLFAELRSQEQAHQATLDRMSQEVMPLRKIGVLKQNCVKEAYQDAISQDDVTYLETELRESLSTVNKLTRQIQELQEVGNSLNESQDFKVLETASSSGSTHVPGKPLVFPRFSSQLRRNSCHRFNTQDFSSFPGGSPNVSPPAPAGSSKAVAGVNSHLVQGDLEHRDEQAGGAQIQFIQMSTDRRTAFTYGGILSSKFNGRAAEE